MQTVLEFSDKTNGRKNQRIWQDCDRIDLCIYEKTSGVQF